MGRSIKIKGKDANLPDLIGKEFSKIEYLFEGGTHQVWFRGATEDYCLWGASCCCDVARVDTIYGDLPSVAGHLDTAQVNGNLFLFANDQGESATVKWHSKHPGFIEQGVKLTKKRASEK